MLKYYIKATEALKNLRKDQAGVVSFEYVIVAACVVVAVIAVFSGTGEGTITGALTAGLGKITSAMAKLTIS
jgi:Flp pilus assembly pilin Flp